MELILMGFIIDILFIPLKIIFYPIAYLIGSLSGLIFGSLANLFDAIFHKESSNSNIYEEEYDPTIAQEIQELADQIAEMRRGNA